MEFLKDILIEAGAIDRYFEGVSPVNLWRARNLSSVGGVFDLVESKVVRPNGKIRPADITITKHGGEDWVLVRDRPRGISTFDKPDIFSRGRWEYYRIPAGMQLPTGLAVVEDGKNFALGATHYTIAPVHDMPLRLFKSLLNALAGQILRESANGS